MEEGFSKAVCATLFAVGMLTAGCAGGQKSQRGSGVACPEGQSFDGTYCRVDQSVATVETSVPVPSEGVGSGGTTSAPVGTGGEGSAPLPTEPVPAEDLPPPTTEAATTPEDEAPPAFATPVDYAMAAQAAPVMQYLARSHLPSGARQLAPPFAGQFAEGQILEQKMQLVAGKCYTVVGLALPPVEELNIELFAEADPRTPLLVDDTQGPQAVLGSRDKCYLSTEGGPARLVLRVTKGQGVAAAQVYFK